MHGGVPDVGFTDELTGGTSLGNRLLVIQREHSRRRLIEAENTQRW